MFALIMIAIQIVLFVITTLLNKPDLQNAKPAGLGEFQFPTASETRAVPILWGTRDILGPNVLWYGDYKILKIIKRVKSGFKKKKVTVGYRYFFGIDLLLCYGPIDRLTRLEISDKVAFSGSVGPFGNGPTTFSVNQPSLLGGKENGGGVVGNFDVFGGTNNQERSSYMVIRGPGKGVGPDAVPGYVGIAHVVATQIEVGESTNIGKYIYRVSKFPDQLSLTGDGHIIAGTVEDGDANPAECLFEILTSTVLGLGVPVSLIDTATFQAAGNTLKAEGLGMSYIVDRIQSARKTVRNITDYIEAILSEGTDGLYRLKLIRDDFGPIPGLELYDEDNIISVDAFSRQSWPQTNNDVNVKYTDREKDHIETGAPAQDLANFRTTGQRNRADVAFPVIGTATQASIVAERELLQRSFPLAKITLTVNKDGQKLRPGDVIRFNWERFGITDMVLRVMLVDLGLLTQGEVKLECVQDVFRIAETIYSSPGNSNFVPIDTDAAAFVFELVRAVPRLYLNLSFFSTAEFPPALGERVHSMATRPIGTVADFEMFVDIGAGAGFEGEIADSAGVTPSGTLQAAFLREGDPVDAAGFVLEGFEGVEDLVPAVPSEISSGLNVALIVGPAADGSLDEVIGWEDRVDNGDGTVDFTGIHRGLCDTVARSHVLGARVFLFSDGEAVSDETYGATQAITVKHQAKTATDNLDIASAAALPLTFPDRLRRPHHPVDLEVDGTHIPAATDETADLVLAWDHRTKDEPILRDYDTGSPDPQDTEIEYDLNFHHGVTGVLLRSQTLVSPAPAWLTYTYTGADLRTDTGEVGDFPLEVRMESRFSAVAVNNPANLTSLQESAYRFNVDMGGAALRSLNFNGTDEYCRTASVAMGYNDTFTLEVWVNWNALGGGAETIFFVKPDGSNNNRIELRVAAATAAQPFNVRLWNSAGTLFKDFDFGSIPAAATWTQIFFTFDGLASGDPLIVGQDGVDVTGSATKTTDTTGARAGATGRHVLGADTTLASGFLDAGVWGFSAWDTVLPVAQIFPLFNGSSGSAVNRRFNFGAYARMDDLVHLWDFRDTASGGDDFGNATGADIFNSVQNIDNTDLNVDVP